MGGVLPHQRTRHRAIAPLTRPERNIMSERTSVEHVGGQRIPTICPLFKAAVLAAGGEYGRTVTSVSSGGEAVRQNPDLLISCDGRDCSWWGSRHCSSAYAESRTST